MSKRSCFFCFLQLLAWKDSFVKRGKVGGQWLVSSGRWRESAVLQESISCSENIGQVLQSVLDSWPDPRNCSHFLAAARINWISLNDTFTTDLRLKINFLHSEENIWRNSISVADCTCPSWSIMTNSHRNCHQAFLHQSSVFITLAISNALSCLTASCIVYLPDSKRKPMDEYKKGLWQNKDGQNCDNFVKQRQRQKVFSTKHGWPALWQLYQSGEFDSCGAY